MTETKTFDEAEGIVDFDAGEGEAATVEIDDYTKSLAQAKAKSVKLVDAITGAVLKKKDAVHFDDLRPSLAEFVRQKHPGIRSDDYISRKAMDDYRAQYIAELLVDERGELSNLEDEVVESLKTFDIVWSMTKGGPGTVSETLALTMYKETFVNSHYGLGSAVAVFLTVVTLVASIIYLRQQLSPKKEI